MVGFYKWRASVRQTPSVPFPHATAGVVQHKVVSTSTNTSACAFAKPLRNGRPSAEEPRCHTQSQGRHSWPLHLCQVEKGRCDECRTRLPNHRTDPCERHLGWVGSVVGAVDEIDRTKKKDERRDSVKSVAT
jgi:hypothetical protein